jgi:hypothetical protein
VLAQLLDLASEEYGREWTHLCTLAPGGWPCPAVLGGWQSSRRAARPLQLAAHVWQLMPHAARTTAVGALHGVHTPLSELAKLPTIPKGRPWRGGGAEPPEAQGLQVLLGVCCC